MPDRPTSRLRSFTDSLGLEIDKLIKTLPGADPMLKGTVEQPIVEPPSKPMRPISPTMNAGAAMMPNVSAVSATASAADAARRARGMEILGVWGRTASAAIFAAAVLWWPYQHACGWMLYVYMTVIAAVLVSGFWATWSAWRVRVAVAHAGGLLVVFWGIVLAAEQVLPRIGYAAISATWSCGG